MRLQVRRVDHERVGFAALTGKLQEHPGKDALLTPTLPTAVEGLVWTVGHGRVPPAQAIANDMDDAAETFRSSARATPRGFGNICLMRLRRSWSSQNRCDMDNPPVALES